MVEINFTIGLGTILAVVVSYNQNKSIIWAMIHGFFGWLYLIYYYLFTNKKKKK